MKPLRPRFTDRADREDDDSAWQQRAHRDGSGRRRGISCRCVHWNRASGVGDYTVGGAHGELSHCRGRARLSWPRAARRPSSLQPHARSRRSGSLEHAFLVGRTCGIRRRQQVPGRRRSDAGRWRAGCRRAHALDQAVRLQACRAPDTTAGAVEPDRVGEAGLLHARIGVDQHQHAEQRRVISPRPCPWKSRKMPICAMRQPISSGASRSPDTLRRGLPLTFRRCHGHRSLDSGLNKRKILTGRRAARTSVNARTESARIALADAAGSGTRPPAHPHPPPPSVRPPPGERRCPHPGCSPLPPAAPVRPRYRRACRSLSGGRRERFGGGCLRNATYGATRTGPLRGRRSCG